MKRKENSGKGLRLSTMAVAMLAFIAVLVLAASPVQATASVEIARTGWQPLPEELNGFNSCNNEWVKLTAQILLLERTIEDASGGLHTGYTLSIRGTGVGIDSGARYVFGGGVFVSESVNQNGVVTFTEAIGAPFISLDKDVPDGIFRGVFHMTFDANGNLKSIISTITIDCR